MLKINSTLIIIVALVILGIVLLTKLPTKYENLSLAESNASVEENIKHGFLPSRQGPYFEGMTPSLRVENNYHRYIAEDCGGDYYNLECRQRAYIKTMKDGTFDRTDLICDRYKNDEKKYYKCLDTMYANLLWMDRFVGLEPCLCADGAKGVSRADMSCFCPLPRPLKDRRPVDEVGDIVMKITQDY